MVMARNRGSKIDVNMTSFMDIITGTVGCILMVMLSMILCATENPTKDIIIKAKQIEKGAREKRVRYVEANNDGITLHPAGQKVSTIGMEDPNSGYMEFIRKIDRDNEYIIFAIRPASASSWERRISRDRHI